jgi:hypothetical protein
MPMPWLETKVTPLMSTTTALVPSACNSTGAAC